METDHNQQAVENAKYLAKVFLGIFILTYFLWYVGGGPERWNKKFKDVDFNTIKKEGIFSKAVIKVEK